MAPRSYSAGPGRPFPANAKGFLFAPVVWIVWFIVLYSIQGAGCEAGFGEPTLRGILGVLTVLAAAAIGVVGVWSFGAWERLRGRTDDAGDSARDQSRFLAYAALLHAGLFFVATLWSGIPILMADVCDG